MFGKLLKYDFRSMLKQFAFIWPAALVLALVNRFTVNSFVTSASGLRQTVSGVAMLVYVGIMIAMFVVTIIFVIQRFFRGLLGDEGYLMHTLPVRPWELIGSKLLCAVVTTLLSIVVAILSILLIMPISWINILDMFKGFSYLFSHWNMELTHSVLFLLDVPAAHLPGHGQRISPSLSVHGHRPPVQQEPCRHERGGLYRHQCARWDIDWHFGKHGPPQPQHSL